MQASIASSRTVESTRTERVTVEGVELLIDIETVRCTDGVMRDLADPFTRVQDDELGTVALALSNKYTVSEQGIQDAILAALMPNRDGDA